MVRLRLVVKYVHNSGPPRFIKTESRRRQLTLAYGEQGQITCTVDAQPPATWTWKCGKVEINKDNPYKAKLKVTNTENESTLKVPLHIQINMYF